MRVKSFLVTLMLYCFFSQTGNSCPIHEQNQEIFTEVITTYLEEKRDISDFFYEIDLIGKEALEKGLDLSCYRYRTDPKTGALYYTTFPLWEGRREKNVIFMLFVWPSQQEALKSCNKVAHYKTNIHSHPIPCAYTVMSGEITERCFVRLNLIDKSIQFCGKQIFYPEEKTVDLNQDSFIHQLLFEGADEIPAITLHVYGCSSVEKLSRVFEENHDEHVYPESCLVHDS